MTNYLRIRPRQSGKTTSLLELLKSFIVLKRFTLICVPNVPACEIVRDMLHNMNISEKNKYVVITTKYQIDTALRGRSFNVILVDEWNSLSYSEKMNIESYVNIFGALLMTIA